MRGPKIHMMLGLLAATGALLLAVLSPIADWEATAAAEGRDGEGLRQIVVRVAASPTHDRRRDERPAELRLRAADYSPELRIDPATLKVVRLDRESREKGGLLPTRWYDDAIPYEFPECEQNVHATDGVALTFTRRDRWGEFYNLQGEGRGGRLVWLHTQEPDESIRYAVSFRLAPAADIRESIPARGFVGDGSPRSRERGATTTGMIHTRIALGDWNGDGLVDLLAGGSTGHVLLYENRGSPQSPKFGYAHLLGTADGTPIDVGWSAAPLAVDWDGDGLTDLLSGCERNRVLFFRNEGTVANPRLVNRGFLRVDGEPLAVPTKPVPKSPEGIYELDYYPVLEAVDWNGDGRRDLLAGGYITGRIYWYENSGAGGDGSPRLVDRGPLDADGEPLNVRDWAAAPCAADFDGDDDLDLISGNMPITAVGGDDSDAAHFLRYWENIGTAQSPRLIERKFPRSGHFPNAVLATPRAADFNGDGLLDLAVSSSENIYLYVNVGTAQRPMFEAHARPLETRWGFVPLPTWGLQFFDADGDGDQDFLSQLTVYRNQERGDYIGEPLLPAGSAIQHPPPRGDSWIFTQLADLDGDGWRDILYGTHEGHVWLHRSLGGAPQRFDEAGARLTLESGEPLHVGPISGPATDFDVLQGSRTTFCVADFDGDGRLDLVVGDTYGVARHFRNIGSPTEPRFAAPVVLGDLKLRMVPYAADWDHNGRVDVVGSSANGTVVVWKNEGGGRFGEPSPITFPPVPYSPSVAVVDWNGDGDDDLVIGTAYGYFCWFERSFLESGYVQAEIADSGER